MVHFFRNANQSRHEKGDEHLTSRTLIRPPFAFSLNISTSLPGLNVEVVGGSGVLIVMDGSWEDYSKDLQLRQPVLKGRLQSNQIICLFLRQSLQLADNTPTLLPFHPAAGKLSPSTCFLTDRNAFFSCKDTGRGVIWKSMPSKVEKAN